MEDKTNTPEEILDLVDENDNIIGEVKIFEANQNPKLIHREIAIFIFDDQKRVLLQQRSFQKIHQPGLWTIAAAGHVTKGLTTLEAAHKELNEELGFDIELKLVEKYRSNIPTESRFVSLFLGKYSDQTIKIEVKEVAQAKFFNRHEFDALIRSDAPINSRSVSFVQRFWAGEFDHLLS